MKSQAEWLELIKTDSCWSCHQLGNKATREIPKALGTFDSPAKAWERRIQSGQAGGAMVGGIGRLGKERALAMFADWTNRIAAGRAAAGAAAAAEASSATSSSPSGTGPGPRPISTMRSPPTSAIPRSTPTACSTARRSSSTDNIPVLDPVHNTPAR